MHRVGSNLLEDLINADGGAYQGVSITDEAEHKYEFVDYREKELLTVLGTIKVKRAYYYDNEHHSGFCPKDRSLDIEGTSYSSGVRRMVSRVGAWRTFGPGGDDLYDLADIRVDAKTVERISQMVGSQVEAFHAAEAKASLSDNIIPLKPVSKIRTPDLPLVRFADVFQKGN